MREGVREGFHIWFSYIHVARKMCNLGFKGLLRILMNPILNPFDYFRFKKHRLRI